MSAPHPSAPPPTPNAVLVLGAGELGTAVLTNLASHPLSQTGGGHSISVLLRPSTIAAAADPANANAKRAEEVRHLTALGIALVPGDVQTDSVEDLSATFAAFDTVVGCLGMTGPAGVQGKIARAVLRAGVRRYIPWQFGVDYDVIGPEAGGGLFAEQCEVREVLRGQKGTEWKVVSTGMFLSFVFEAVFGVVVQQSGGAGAGAGRAGEQLGGVGIQGGLSINALGGWGNGVTLTDVRDIGRCTAELVWRWGEIEEQIVFTAGETVSYRHLAETLRTASGREVKLQEWTVPFLEEELKKDPGNPIKKYRVVFAQGKGVAWPKDTSFNAKRGIQTMSLAEGVEKYLRA